MLFIYIGFAKEELSITESNSTQKNHPHVYNFPLQYECMLFSSSLVISLFHLSTI